MLEHRQDEEFAEEEVRDQDENARSDDDPGCGSTDPRVPPVVLSPFQHAATEIKNEKTIVLTTPVQRSAQVIVSKVFEK